ncbi:efflux RND transporter periplasmic adaptor subunit [Steroidobacter sp.]|uniref:efflux RND transporter periplasmic adaptor subunit n=1 Tax=Steroidobacter sp. TaxID=1978227 RepID=UPI001A3C6DAC|nr:efflux RND transporter periplasmic adaptor subunit [Steroidobacter sp.]MBL8267437.1 efflux RND transporter periplasmic adaptor subunit [Steroidobacter sp.]
MSPTDSHRGLRRLGVVIAVIAIVIVVSGIGLRAHDRRELREWTEEQAIPTVAVISPTNEDAAARLELPGRLEALSRAPLHARVAGYLKTWKVDIGTPVKAGQLLAEIEAPDIEQQLLQAEADLASAEANAALAASTAKRWQSMLGRDSVSRQEVDEKAGDLAAKEALVKAGRANVERLRTMQGFTRIVAPFDGVVTARNTDIGELIAAGGSAGRELFVVSDTRRLRVYVNVPQVYASQLNTHATASIAVPDQPGKKYSATVEASARSVNVATGTTLIQLSVDNRTGELMPGGYASVSFELAGGAQALRVPASALIFDQSGLRVATVGANNEVVMKPITIARDHGAFIEVATGLEVTDRVIATPPDGLIAGSTVRVLQSQVKEADASQGHNASG